MNIPRQHGFDPSGRCDGTKGWESRREAGVRLACTRSHLAPRRHGVQIRKGPLLLGEHLEYPPDGHSREVVELLLRHGHVELLARLLIGDVETAHGVHQGTVTVCGDDVTGRGMVRDRVPALGCPRVPRRVRKGRVGAFRVQKVAAAAGRDGSGRTKNERGWVLETTPCGVRLRLGSFATTSHLSASRAPGCGSEWSLSAKLRLVIFSDGRLTRYLGTAAPGHVVRREEEVAADDADGGRARSREASWSGRRVVPCGTSPAEATGPAREAGEGEEGGGFHQRECGGWRGWSGFQATAGGRVGAWRGETRQERVVFGLGGRRRR